MYSSPPPISTLKLESVTHNNGKTKVIYLIDDKEIVIESNRELNNDIRWFAEAGSYLTDIVNYGFNHGKLAPDLFLNQWQQRQDTKTSDFLKQKRDIFDYMKADVPQLQISDLYIQDHKPIATIPIEVKVSLNEISVTDVGGTITYFTLSHVNGDEIDFDPATVDLYKPFFEHLMDVYSYDGETEARNVLGTLRGVNIKFGKQPARIRFPDFVPSDGLFDMMCVLNEQAAIEQRSMAGAFTVFQENNAKFVVASVEQLLDDLHGNSRQRAANEYRRNKESLKDVTEHLSKSKSQKLKNTSLKLTELLESLEAASNDATDYVQYGINLSNLAIPAEEQYFNVLIIMEGRMIPFVYNTYATLKSNVFIINDFDSDPNLQTAVFNQRQFMMDSARFHNRFGDDLKGTVTFLETHITDPAQLNMITEWKNTLDMLPIGAISPLIFMPRPNALFERLASQLKAYLLGYEAIIGVASAAFAGFIVRATLWNTKKYNDERDFNEYNLPSFKEAVVAGDVQLASVVAEHDPDILTKVNNVILKLALMNMDWDHREIAQVLLKQRVTNGFPTAENLLKEIPVASVPPFFSSANKAIRKVENDFGFPAAFEKSLLRAKRCVEASGKNSIVDLKTVETNLFFHAAAQFAELTTQDHDMHALLATHIVMKAKRSVT